MDDPPFEDAKVWRKPPTTPFLDNFLRATRNVCSALSQGRCETIARSRRSNFATAEASSEGLPLV